jgi:hypothetical protein
MKFILGLALLLAPIASTAYMTINPGSMEFGSVKIGTQASQMFFVNNMGPEDVRINGCMVSGAFYCQLNCFGTLYQGQSCTGTILFRPISEHYEFEQTIIITDRGTLNMSVHGTGKR